METPCPRCGHHKTESVRHGFLYDTFWNMGYHLRACSFCNRWRLFKRVDLSQPHPDDLTAEDLQEQFNRKIAQSMREDSGATPLPQPTLTVGPEEESHQSEPQPVQASVTVAEEIHQAEAQPVEVSVGVAEEWRESEAESESEDYALCPRCGGSGRPDAGRPDG